LTILVIALLVALMLVAVASVLWRATPKPEPEPEVPLAEAPLDGVVPVRDADTMAEPRRQPGTGALEETDSAVKRPELYRVVLHNDDYTTMEFVVQVLETVFLKHPAEAYRVMMQVHVEGHGVCGVYPLEIAETKAATVHDLARERGFPLRASVEEE